MFDPFESLYNTSSLREVFGDKFCGPDKLEHWKETLIAKFDDVPKSDGHSVEVYCTAAPAEFFKIKVLDFKNSIGVEQPGYSLSTGSGCAGESFKIAEMINGGMLDLDRAEKRTLRKPKKLNTTNKG
jgi:hypothetical protein